MKLSDAINGRTERAVRNLKPKIIGASALVLGITIVSVGMSQAEPVNNGGATYQTVCVNDWTGEIKWRLNTTITCEQQFNNPTTGKDKVTGVGHWFTEWIVKRDGMGCGEGRHPEVRTDDGRSEESCLN